MVNHKLFVRYIGIDYSGAEVSVSRLRGLQVFQAVGSGEAWAVRTSAGPWNWTRKEMAHWLLEQFRKDEPIIVGIDHGFSFPDAYFQRYSLSTWDEFLEDFCKHWPTGEDHVYVDFVRDGVCGRGKDRQGDSRWRRMTEIQAGGAKSVFHFDVPGSVAKSTHAGIPWLLFLRKELGEKLFFWPFDGFAVPPNRSVIVEIFPSLFRSRYPRDKAMTQDAQDAYSVAKWLQEMDREGDLTRYFESSVTPEDQAMSRREGWILGVK